MEDEIFNAGSVTLRRSGFTFKLFDILMRLPPVYMMDTLLVYNMGVSSETVTTVQPSVSAQTGEMMNVSDHIANSTDLYQTFSTLYGGNPALLLIPHVLRFLVCTILYAFSFLVFLLPTESLIIFYRYLVSMSVMPLSYYSHKLMIESCHNYSIFTTNIDSLLSLSINYNFISTILVNYVLQCSLASILERFIKVSGSLSQSVKDYLVFNMITPCLIALVSLPSSVVLATAFISNILPAMLLGISLGQNMNKIIHSLTVMYRIKRETINNFGINTFIEAEWSRLRVPSVLRYFWLSRMGGIMLLHKQSPLITSPDLSLGAMLECVRSVLVQGSDTLVTVLGMTSVLATLSHWLGLVFQVALASEAEEEKSVASVSAVLFFVLALQTGLTGMESEKRFQQICKNLCLLLTAILHFVHSMVQPVLMSLSASRSSNRASHVRALLICLFLILAPSTMITVLWQHFTLGTWLLAVSAFCLEVMVKVLVTIIIYLLFMWDTHCQDGLWESLDDWVYYIRAVGNIVEFCFAVFLFFNGGWILLFESGGTIRACMMLIHAYFNIWCEARKGWSAFTKRRTAVAKINSLDDATEEEIAKHNDVCAICYQEMTVAKLTKCRHMFHSICLRKWLYMQDNCPMCHEKLYRSDATSQTDAEIIGAPAVVPANNNRWRGDNDEEDSDEDDSETDED